MPVKQLKDFLDNHHVNYQSMPHSPAFTAQEVAASAHVSGKHFAKAVIVKIDGHLGMVVLSANGKIDFNQLRKAAGTKGVDLASESDFKNTFSGCEVGAMPPFGNLYDMPTFISSDLSHEDRIAFNAGSHSEVMEIAFKDYEQLVKPKLIEG